MPFKSEAQRRYLWANEPEIARDWTDTMEVEFKKIQVGLLDSVINLVEELMLVE